MWNKIDDKNKLPINEFILAGLWVHKDDGKDFETWLICIDDDDNVRDIHWEIITEWEAKDFEYWMSLPPDPPREYRK